MLIIKLKWIAIATAIALAMVILPTFFGWNPSPLLAQPITRDRCESDPAFVFIPGGDYLAGSDRAERNYGYQISAKAFGSTPEQVHSSEQQLKQQAWFEQELPRQLRSLSDFCMGRNLVTHADYQAFVQATGHRAPGISAAEYQQQGFLVHAYSEVQPYLWQGDRYPNHADRHPVVLISYNDAIAFAQWRGVQDSLTYRLPTAAEWEKAARGTDGRYFPWGNEWQDDATNWAKDGSAAAAPLGTSAIATFPLSRSLYGVEDMAGNVFEYTSTLQQDLNQTRSVMKGCSWDDSPGFCRAAYQHTRPVESRHILFGFRLVRE